MDEDFEKIEALLQKLPPHYQAVAWRLAQGYSQERSGRDGDISQARVSQLMCDPLSDFRKAVDALRLWLSEKDRAERLRIAWQAIRQLAQDDALDLQGTNLLAWLKFVSELEGDLGSIVEVRFESPATMKDLLAGLD